MTLAVGFDPSFIDIIVEAKNKEGEFLDKLPVPGNHNRTASILQRPGGNGVNVSIELEKLKIPNTLVSSMSNYFVLMLNKLKLKYTELSPILTKDQNQTVAINWLEGDNQYNSVVSSLGKPEFSKDVYDLWVGSPIKMYLNWGLNPKSPEWIASLYLASNGYKYQEIFDELDVIKLALNAESTNSGLVLIEPSNFDFHRDEQALFNLLRKLLKDTNSYLLYNEFEESYFNENLKGLSYNKLLHTAKDVQIDTPSESITVEVPKLKQPGINFTGAGDSFLAGIISSKLKDNSPQLTKYSIVKGIEAAQNHILGI